MLGCLWAASARAEACPTDRIDERVRVSHVYDGDTLILQDGRRLRLIGINTPELGRDGEAHQPGALGARDELRRRVFFNQDQLGLRFDREREDRHGRLLAHAFLAEGRNLTATLLTRGQGYALTVPPNTWRAECYHRAADAAQQSGTGIWSRPAYQPREAAELGLQTTGFQRIRGRVTHLGEGQYNRWINLRGNVALRIAKTDLEYFEDFPWDSLEGRRLQAEGWMYQRRGQLRMRVRHPLAIELLDDPGGRE